ncbi:PXMP2/4 family protein 4-like [Vigna radiata var. radiata]|uniref:PXMP2/4 family protein 4-like n=1 Tax=Vigna radiata var. radiata TaxID=3916 RepID=A0A1S3TY50_VIGRR|nr:PXMP2/4 family protein 4-like [Vigna radiata var. radiata]
MVEEVRVGEDGELAIDQAQSLDLKRTFVFTFLGFALVGPTLHFWYLYLSKLVTLPGASGAFLRLVLDQLLFSPIFIGVFLATLVTLEGNPSQAVPKLKQVLSMF